MARHSAGGTHSAGIGEFFGGSHRTVGRPGPAVSVHGAIKRRGPLSQRRPQWQPNRGSTCVAWFQGAAFGYRPIVRARRNRVRLERLPNGRRPPQPDTPTRALRGDPESRLFVWQMRRRRHRLRALLWGLPASRLAEWLRRQRAGNWRGTTALAAAATSVAVGGGVVITAAPPHANHEVSSPAREAHPDMAPTSLRLSAADGSNAAPAPLDLTGTAARHARVARAVPRRRRPVGPGGFGRRNRSADGVKQRYPAGDGSGRLHSGGPRRRGNNGGRPCLR